MSNSTLNQLSLSTAIGRWSGLGPYYAMFPKEFAFKVVEEYSKPGDAVIDPFAGRASSVYAAAAMQRSGCGIEINPVGWLYGFVKLKPASKTEVLTRIKNLGEMASLVEQQRLDNLPEFFTVCYARTVLGYLIAARDALDWKNNLVDATLMAIILVHLHGNRENSLSNQMRQGKAMSPDYSIRWWRERQLTPPKIDPVEFLTKRVEWRYTKGAPNLENGNMLLGDSTSLIGDLAEKVYSGSQSRFNLLFTSPPYFGITNYHYDQWLRLWMLGGTERPTWTGEKWRGKFESMPDYRNLLQTVFQGCAEIMTSTASIYVRTSARIFTHETTIDTLREAFPQKSLKYIKQPFTKNTQTALFGDKLKKPGEIDIIMQS
ncbi:MAG: DNA methyltransferase [Microcoleus anatoxicus]|uniref:DNA methyltransferase n=1 Tax=Microcoleus anatoxicus TaxID=2705319 RepID=UPI00366BD6F3